MPSGSFIFKHFIIQQDACPMKVGTDAMILGAWADCTHAKHILDIGTGTGILSLMLTQRCTAKVDAVEMDDNAFIQAKENFQNSAWSQRLRIFHMPVQRFNNQCERKYDLIICNPPYFEENIKASRESKKYTERILARSSSSLSYRDLIEEVNRLMHPQGRFLVILPFKSVPVFTGIAGTNNLYPSKRLDICSKQGQAPVRTILAFGKEISEVGSGKLIIYKPNGMYTDAYIALTREFYAIDMAKRQAGLLSYS